VPLGAYDCDEGLALLVVGDPGARSIEARWADSSRRLERASREDALVYSDAETTLTLRGDAASLSVAPHTPLSCRHGARAQTLERVAAEGALLWGVGNEPGWSLTLYPDRFVLEADYGESHYEGPIALGPASDGFRTFEARAPNEAAASIRIRIRRGLCRDGMSGAAFGAEVEIVRDGEAYRGCGVWLRPEESR
jgi:uncharacterized membrane protein